MSTAPPPGLLSLLTVTSRLKVTVPMTLVCSDVGHLKGHSADDLGVFRCGSSVTSFRSVLTSDLRAQCVHCTLTDDPHSDHMTLLPVLRNVTL